MARGETIVLFRGAPAKALFFSGARNSFVRFALAALWIALLCAAQPARSQTQTSPDIELGQLQRQDRPGSGPALLVRAQTGISLPLTLTVSSGNLYPRNFGSK